jgi:conserved oligomeric Golgi complex subunit 6
LTRELANVRDDHSAITEVLVATKESLSEMSNNHARELEEAAKSRAEETIKLKEDHSEEMAVYARERTHLIGKVVDLEGELATLKAAMEAHEAAAPKTNGSAHSSGPGVTKDELQKMHEAHNLKISDLLAAHEKAIQALKEELDAAHDREDELKQDIARKAMEIQYIEQEQEESQEEISRSVDCIVQISSTKPSASNRYKADIDHLTSELAKMKEAAA